MKDSIDIPIACFKCRKYGHHATECGKREKAKKEKDKKEKTKKKQDGIDIKPVTLPDLMTEAKIVKQEIKEDNSIDIDEQNIAKIINLKEFSNPMTDPPNPPTDKEVTNINVSNNNKIDSNRQNFLNLIDRVIFQKWHTEITLVITKEFLVINKEFLTKIALIDSGVDMNYVQEGLIPLLKYYKKII